MSTLPHGLTEPTSTCIACERVKCETDMRVCVYCQTNMRRDLDELPSLLRQATTLSGDSAVLAGLPAGPTGSPPKGDRVTGSTQAPTPVDIGLLNLVGPGSACVSDTFGDQHGELPLWRWLADWCMDWASMRGERTPHKTVTATASWLRMRVDWAGLKHPAIGDFARELVRQHRTVRLAAGHTPELPEPCLGVACPGCNGRTLSRFRGDITCARCTYIMDGHEYDLWVRQLAATHITQEV